MRRLPISAAALVAIALSARVASAQATPPLSKTVRDLEATKAELAKLKPTAERSESDTSSAFRFMKYGVTAGVSIALYSPGSPRNSLSGVAGGAMPFVGFFPAYWSGTGARNTFCAVEWSAPQSVAEEAGKSQQTKEEKASEERAVKEAEKKVEEADKAVEKAETVEELAPKMDPAIAPSEIDAAAKDAAKKVDAAKDALTAANKTAKDPTKYDLKALDDERDGLEELREDREATLEDQISKWETANPTLAAMAPDALVQLARDHEQKRVEVEECLKALAPGAPNTCGTLPGACALWVQQKSSMSPIVGQAACNVADARSRELRAKSEYKRAQDAYRGARTTCGAHKIGFFFGYPAMFNASTYVESTSTPNDAKRDVTPIMSHGFVVAPNALVALTAGSWVGMADVTETETAVIWGLTLGAAITADVFSLIR